MHLQVETISYGYGYNSKSNNFPPKIEFLKNIGVIAPAILKNLNSIRNRIEHDYSCCSEKEVADFIDVVELFLYATLNFVSVFPDESIFVIGDGSNDDVLHKETEFPIHIKIMIAQNLGTITVLNHDESDKLIFTVEQSAVNYSEWIKHLFSHLFFIPV